LLLAVAGIDPDDRVVHGSIKDWSAATSKRYQCSHSPGSEPGTAAPWT
jgi:hypothetical protein